MARGNGSLTNTGDFNMYDKKTITQKLTKLYIQKETMRYHYMNCIISDQEWAEEKAFYDGYRKGLMHAGMLEWSDVNACENYTVKIEKP